MCIGMCGKGIMGLEASNEKNVWSTVGWACALGRGICRGATSVGRCCH